MPSPPRLKAQKHSSLYSGAEKAVVAGHAIRSAEFVGHAGGVGEFGGAEGSAGDGVGVAAEVEGLAVGDCCYACGGFVEGGGWWRGRTVRVCVAAWDVGSVVPQCGEVGSATILAAVAGADHLGYGGAC